MCDILTVGYPQGVYTRTMATENAPITRGYTATKDQLLKRLRRIEGQVRGIEGMVEDGEAIPEPSSLEQIMADPDNREGVAVLIPLRDEAGRTVRVNITLPEATLAEIDRYAEAHGFTRSGFLAQAAKRAIEDA